MYIFLFVYSPYSDIYCQIHIGIARCHNYRISLVCKGATLADDCSGFNSRTELFLGAFLGGLCPANVTNTTSDRTYVYLSVNVIITTFSERYSSSSSSSNSSSSSSSPGSSSNSYCCSSTVVVVVAVVVVVVKLPVVIM